MPDPIAQAINRMLDHIHQLDQQVESMKQALNTAGIDCKTPSMSQLNDCEINDGDQ
jgi:serine O-acetyltransferase